MPNCRRFLILKGLILKGLILCSHGGLESPEAEPEDDEFKFCTLNCVLQVLPPTLSRPSMAPSSLQCFTGPPVLPACPLLPCCWLHPMPAHRIYYLKTAYACGLDSIDLNCFMSKAPWNFYPEEQVQLIFGIRFLVKFWSIGYLAFQS